MSKERTKADLMQSQTARQNLRETRALLGLPESEERVPPVVAVAEGVAAATFARATAILQQRRGKRR